ncbi:MAG TPA: hypothetical protein PLG43_02060 [Spirochaetia bacterium]|nr:hypothetical protein [Spirochaetia bacterium]
MTRRIALPGFNGRGAYIVVDNAKSEMQSVFDVNLSGNPDQARTENV